MFHILKEEEIESTPSFLSEGYTFMENRWQKFSLDLFETRIMICITKNTGNFL